MIIEYKIKFDEVDDPVKTEELIYHQLKNIDLKIPYVALPIAYTINKFGLIETQKIINEIEIKYPFKKLFVCQHILVNKLNFKNNIVFTPHTEKNDNFFFIPHFNPNYYEKPNIKKIEERKYKMSFLGDFNTHKTREMLKKINSEEILVEETGNWFFYKPKEEQIIFKQLYTEILNDSKISLCPRGTGPSTIRLFESMSVGSIPMIFNNLKLPSEIENSIFKINIYDLLLGKFNLPNNKELQNMSDFLLEYYWDYLSNENLYKTIINQIQ